jgi:aminoglycoside 2'-N-acetyltransferase I
VPTIRRFTSPEASADLLAEIRRLTDAAFEGEFSDDDWDHALGGVHVIATDGGAVLAHASVVPRTLEAAGRALRTGYVEAVATSAANRHTGLGSAVMTEIGATIRAEYELGALGTGAYEFYERLGWERWNGPTFVRRDAGLTRTSWDDGAIMVLRFGPSRSLDLAGPISCEERSGDDW